MYIKRYGNSVRNTGDLANFHDLEIHCQSEHSYTHIHIRVYNRRYALVAKIFAKIFDYVYFKIMLYSR